MLRLIWNISIRIRLFLRIWMPTNILLDALRTRRGLKWGVPAMLLAIVYFAAGYWCTALIAGGAPGWLHLVVLLCIYNAFKFLIYGPIGLARLLAARHTERREEHAEALRPVPEPGYTLRAPTGHEALPLDQHWSAHLSRTPDAHQG